MKRTSLLLYACIAAFSNGAAQERIELDGTVVKGSRESPKSLFIVPWKSPSSPDEFKLRHPFPDILSGPVRRDELLREMEYFDVLHGGKTPFPID